MLRNTLLAGAAVGVISLTATAALADPIDLNNNDTVAGNAVEADNFELADELAIGALGLDGAIEGTLDPNTGATWTTDDALLTLRISGPAVLDGPITAAVLENDGQVANCFVAASIVQTSPTEATFLLSGVDGCDGNGVPPGSDGDLDFRLPITMTAHGTVTVSAELRTDSGGTLLDQQSHANTQVNAITSVSAFNVVFDGAVGSGAGTDTFTPIAGSPPYLALSGGNLMGQYQVTVDLTVHDALSQAAFVSLLDVNDITTTLFGKFDSYDDGVCNIQIYNGADGGEGDCPSDPGASVDVVNDTAVIPNEPTDAGDVLQFYLYADGDEQILTSDYSATVSVDLVAAFSDFAASGDFESIEREGANIVVPIFNSATRGAASGGNYVMTIGNIAATPTGAIQVQVLDTDCDGSAMPASCAGTYASVGDTFNLNGGAGIPAGESVTFTSAQIEAAVGGDFGKGDLLFIIEADQADVTATRLLVRPDGVLEVSIGDADERLDD